MQKVNCKERVVSGRRRREIEMFCVSSETELTNSESVGLMRSARKNGMRSILFPLTIWSYRAPEAEG